MRFSPQSCHKCLSSAQSVACELKEWHIHGCCCQISPASRLAQSNYYPKHMIPGLVVSSWHDALVPTIQCQAYERCSLNSSTPGMLCKLCTAHVVLSPMLHSSTRTGVRHLQHKRCSFVRKRHAVNFSTCAQVSGLHRL